MRRILCNGSYLLTLVCMSVTFTSTQTQRKTPRDVVMESNRQELDNLLLRKPILATEDKSARQAVLKQINDDFKNLQVLNNKLMSEVEDQGGVDYKEISTMLADIGSRAARLKSNLALPKVDEKKEKANSELTTAAALKDRLMEFDKVVMSFATNPIFQQANVIDVELAKQASGDLATIIERSGKLKKAAATLAKK
ncbi:MAG TPA: hypothetical protein VIJ87_09990 [Pyrinomonadaceae bacterium]